MTEVKDPEFVSKNFKSELLIYQDIGGEMMIYWTMIIFGNLTQSKNWHTFFTKTYSFRTGWLNAANKNHKGAHRDYDQEKDEGGPY